MSNLMAHQPLLPAGWDHRKIGGERVGVNTGASGEGRILPQFCGEPLCNNRLIPQKNIALNREKDLRWWGFRYSMDRL